MKSIILILTSLITLSAWAGGSGNSGGGSTLLPGGNLFDAERDFKQIMTDPQMSPEHLPDWASKWEQDVYVNPENPSAAYMSEAAQELARLMKEQNVLVAKTFVRHIALDGVETVYQTGQIAKTGQIEVQQHVKALEEIQMLPQPFRESYMKSFASQKNLWVPVTPYWSGQVSAEDLARAMRETKYQP